LYLKRLGFIHQALSGRREQRQSAAINQKVNAGNEARIGSQQPAAHVRDIAEAIGANPGPVY
jgi:hypothetical protein